jgi:aminopeptidase YwaD
MIKYLTGCIALLLLVLPAAQAQKRKKKKNKAETADVFEAVAASLQRHIVYLASDSLEGRRTGTRGEQLAYQYIVQQFEKAGLLPKGANNSYLQPFEVNEGRQYEKTSFFYINDNNLKAGTDYFPLSFSGNAQVEALASPVLKESGVPWFLDLKDELVKNQANPHYDITPFVEQKAKEYAAKGANAVLIYNSGKKSDGLLFDAKAKPAALQSIPVIYLNSTPAATYLKDPTATLDLKIKIAVEDKKRTGTNVAGFIDNGAATTIIIGAHYDHLGYGEDHNSLYTGQPAMIHNGADDNASGTAALLELPALLKSTAYKNNNYLFIAFSGEELGLFGSKYFTENATVDLGAANYMINMDMVGRLNDSSKALTVGGYGTSPLWGEILPALNSSSLTMKFDSSGTGPSDHTSFYRKNIPVLFFFTGTHGDYHKPGDDAEKINFKGEVAVLKLIYNIVGALDGRGKLAFTKTRENSSASSSTRFKVSLGVMPDYTFSGGGVRIDGVSEGKLAQKIGLQAGDVLLQLDDAKISSVENYMQVLSKYSKGDPAKLTIKRGDKEMKFDITF